MSISPNWITEEDSFFFLSGPTLQCAPHRSQANFNNYIGRALFFCKIFWYLSIASRIRSKLLNMADICSYASNSFPRTPMWLLSLRLCTSPKLCTGCSSAALGGNLFRILLASC